MTIEYWKECLESSFGEHGITATQDQIKRIAQDIEGGHECYGMAYPIPSSPFPSEIARLKRELQDERDKIICRECNGSGSIVSHGPSYSARSECWKCNGYGRHSR